MTHPTHEFIAHNLLWISHFCVRIVLWIYPFRDYQLAACQSFDCIRIFVARRIQVVFRMLDFGLTPSIQFAAYYLGFIFQVSQLLAV